MKKVFSLTFGLIASGIALSLAILNPFSADAVSPNASASCTEGRLTISMTPPENHDRWAIRIDDRRNSWNGTPANSGDTVVDGFKENSFSRGVTRGTLYNWWVHSISKSGAWSDATGGPIVCPINQPTYTEQVYEYPYLILRWKSVEGAARYAIRIDDRERSSDGYFPVPFKAEVGDRLDDNVTTNEFRFKVGEDRKFTWWVHAIDQNGVWSDMSRWLTIRTN